ncbi:MAG TPA: YaiI/YqxD family protein [Propylenella sp.]|nr:YaiI/YqxD family protein [Propylenella sp.]
MSEPAPIQIFVDGDACPVKAEVYRIAERHGLMVYVVANSYMSVPRDPLVKLVVVGAGMDEADDWIAERVGGRDIVVTSDVPLASRCIKAGAQVIAPSGRAFTKDSIGMALATRNLMQDIRDAGEITGGPRPFSPRDRSTFLAALHQAIVRLQRS